jgi:hypothetical protein
VRPGDAVEFAAAFVCQLWRPGAPLAPPEQDAVGQVVEVDPLRPFARVAWWRGRGFAGRTTLVARCRLWVQGQGVPNICPQCAAGRCGGAFDLGGLL